MRWRQVSDAVPSRNDKQCRERFCNVLDPQLKREWTPQEDAQLLAAVAEHTEANGRTRSGNCCRHFFHNTMIFISRSMLLRSTF